MDVSDGDCDASYGLCQKDGNLKHCAVFSTNLVSSQEQPSFQINHVDDSLEKAAQDLFSADGEDLDQLPNASVSGDLGANTVTASSTVPRVTTIIDPTWRQDPYITPSSGTWTAAVPSGSADTGDSCDVGEEEQEEEEE